MKRGTARHPKMTRLMSELDVSRPAAVGYLVCLWEWVAEFTPDGDISRYVTEACHGAGWEGDDKTFLQALGRAGWIDQDGDIIVIHDWIDHCPDYVRKRLMRAGLSRDRDSGGQRRTTADNGLLVKAGQVKAGQGRSAEFEAPSSKFPEAPSPKFSESAARLSQLFAFHYAGIGQEKSPYASVPAMKDLLDRGISEVEIEAWIIAKDRPKTQKQWQFLKRWEVVNASGTGNSGHNLSRVHAKPGKYAGRATVIDASPPKHSGQSSSRTTNPPEHSGSTNASDEGDSEHL